MDDPQTIITGSYCPIPAIPGGIGSLLRSGYKYRICEDTGDFEKLCHSCGEYYPADTEFFSVEDQNPSGLNRFCHACVYEETELSWTVFGSGGYCPLPADLAGIQRLLLIKSKYRICNVTGNLEKLCNSCSEFLPFSTVFFSDHPSSLSRLHKICLVCAGKRSALKVSSSNFLRRFRNSRSVEQKLQNISNLVKRVRIYGDAGFSLKEIAAIEKRDLIRFKRTLKKRRYHHPAPIQLIENRIVFSYSTTPHDLLTLLAANGYTAKNISTALKIDHGTIQKYADAHNILL